MKRIVLFFFVLTAGCASEPPPKPLTREEAISRAVEAAAMAGQDPTAVYENLNRMACLHDADALKDLIARANAFDQCHRIWPARAVAAPAPQNRTVTTNCIRSDDGGSTQCQSY
jgi:hypothetical protein